MGLFDQVTKIKGQVSTVENNLAAAANDPVVLGVKEVIKLLPEGGLKSWVSKNPAKFWTDIGQIFTGRKYTKNEYRIGERYLDQIAPDAPVDGIKDTGQVPDDLVPVGQVFFTTAFGVRITTTDDLDALENGVDAYYARPEKTDIPRKAVERAVMLKQRYFPNSTLNNTKWDTTKFEQFPLVAPIPGIALNTYYTGDLPGGAKAKNGVIEGDAALKQVIDSLGLNADGSLKTTSKRSGIGTFIVVGLVLAALAGAFKKKKGRG